jgi:glycosyltransferase involved in cell wall biosynthesis
MYHGNLATTLAARAANVKRYGWNVRCTPDERPERWETRSAVKMGARLSPFVPWIIYNSHRAKAQHRERGYSDLHATVIPNGFDCNALGPDTQLRASLREQLKISPDQIIVGTLARWHPQKDYPTLIRAAAEVCRRFPQSCFVGIGRGVDWLNRMLLQQIDSLGLRDRFRLLGEVHDGSRHAALFDINVLASAFGEGFPNAIAEGMACGVPCVGTDVGDTGRIIGNTGRLVPPSDCQALTEAICQLVSLPTEERRRLGAAARERVAHEFSIEQNIAAYSKLFRAGEA